MIPFGNRFLDAAFLGLRAALSGIIAAMIVKSWKKCVAGSVHVLILLAALAAICIFKANPALVVVAAAVSGVALKFAAARRASTRKFMSSLWALPLIFLKYGSIAFGGGYVLVPVYIADFVGKAAPFLQLSWREFADVMALTQMTPGPIAVNCATFFGYRMGMESLGCLAGALGCAVAATVCILLPGTVLLYIALTSLEKFKTSRLVQGIMTGVKPVTVAMMLNALWAFLSMSAWTVSDGGAVSWHPVASALVVACAVSTLSGKVGVVMQIFAAAAVSAAFAAAV
jgi:chromate transporter